MFLSQENTTFESQTSLVHMKIPKLKTQLVCSFMCKIQYLNKSYAVVVPRNLNHLCHLSGVDFSFTFAIKYTAIQESARGTRGKDTNIASPS